MQGGARQGREVVDNKKYNKTCVLARDSESMLQLYLALDGPKEPPPCGTCTDPFAEKDAKYHMNIRHQN